MEREPPDQDQLETMRERAVNSSGHHVGSGQRELRAQILQTQQLNYDVYLLNQNITDLNENLETYSTWSRRLTLVLIFVGVLQLAVIAGVL